jgi:indole-3-glycerol phosphate synthase
MILDQILKDKIGELETAKLRVPFGKMQKIAHDQPETLDLAARLTADHIQIIAEVKKASPSKGIICRDFDPLKIAKIYADNKAAAISVLTETKYFQGSLNYLLNINNTLGSDRPPLLRKDFIFDPYQIYESRAFGADAILLIVAILDLKTLREFLIISRELQMRCLVEVHNEKELDLALMSEAKIIGINNRDLRTFDVDLETTSRLSKQVPDDRIIVSESGIKNRADMAMLHSWGVNAALVGESLIASSDIAGKMRELL